MKLISNILIAALIYIAIVLVLFITGRERLAKLLIDGLIALALVAIALLLLWLLAENSLCVLQNIKQLFACLS